MEEKLLKKTVYQRLSLSVFGNLIGFDKNKDLFVNRIYFVNNSSGDFYLISLNIEDELNTEEKVVLTVFKEEETISEIIDIKVKGSVEVIAEGTEQWKEGFKLFEEKSPFVGNLPWTERENNYTLYFLKAESIIFQTIKDERESRKPLFLVREN